MVGGDFQELGRIGEAVDMRRDSVEHLVAWGGMPALLPLTDADRRDWLRSYQQTFLERDLADPPRVGTSRIWSSALGVIIPRVVRAP